MSANAPSAPVGELRTLPMDQIDPNPGNPRLIFPQEELDKLIDSISHEGVLVPIVVFPTQDGRFVLVDGERRFRSATELGLTEIPALITGERTEQQLLVQMFNIHLIREPWRDMPTAKALGRLAEEIQKGSGAPATEKQLRDLTGLSGERIKQLSFALQLPGEWQDHIAAGSIPLNWFWELDRNVIKPMAAERPALFSELGERKIAEAFIKKRLNGITATDTVSLRKVRPIIRLAKEDADEGNDQVGQLDQILRSLVTDDKVTIEDAYEETVQITVETEKLSRRAETMIANFTRLLARAKSQEERDYIKAVGRDLTGRLGALIDEN